MRTALLRQGVLIGNIAIYDVALLVSADGGETWTEATAETFPSDGLQITLPYPAGRDSSYIFKVAHMFTSDTFGKIPGDGEFPAVENTEDCISFIVTGLSPISVGQTKPSEPEKLSVRPPRSRSYYPSISKPLGAKPETKPEPDVTPKPVTPVSASCTGGSDCPSYDFDDVGGYGNSTFGPNDSTTREQLAVVLWRYAGSPAATDKELHFADAGKISSYIEALKQAAEKSIVNGMDDGKFEPQGGQPCGGGADDNEFCGEGTITLYFVKSGRHGECWLDFICRLVPCRPEAWRQAVSMPPAMLDNISQQEPERCTGGSFPAMEIGNIFFFCITTIKEKSSASNHRTAHTAYKIIL